MRVLLEKHNISTYEKDLRSAGFWGLEEDFGLGLTGQVKKKGGDVQDTAFLFYFFPKKKKKDHKYNLRARKLCSWSVFSRSNISVQTKRTSECKRRRQKLH